MLGSTADISHLCQHSNTVPTFPDNTHILGRYLGPAIDVNSALTAKILKWNGQVVFQSTLRHLTQDEINDLDHLSLCQEFNTSISQSLGPSAESTDFPADDHTPDPDIDLADNDGIPLGDDDAAPGDTAPTPEVGDNYVSSELMFPRNGEMAKGRIVSRKRDTDGNPIGRAHSNPVLDTRLYLVEFEDGDVTELTANEIA